jgi:hypothetical protein
MGGIGATPSRSVVAKDIRNLRTGRAMIAAASRRGIARRDAAVGQLLAAAALTLTDSITTRAATFAEE